MRPYEDELWYSVLARTIQESGMFQMTSITRFLYGTSREYTSFDYAVKLDELLKFHGLPDNYGMDIIMHYTNFPFFAMMKNRELKAVLLNSIKTGHPYESQEAKVLRYCPMCYTNDCRHYGESYWHRSHQLPLVTACAKHGCLLEEYGRMVVSGPKIMPKCCHVENTSKIRLASPLEISIAKDADKIVRCSCDISPYAIIERIRQLYKSAGFFSGGLPAADKVRQNLCQAFPTIYNLCSEAEITAVSCLRPKWKHYTAAHILMLLYAIDQDLGAVEDVLSEQNRNFIAGYAAAAHAGNMPQKVPDFNEIQNKRSHMLFLISQMTPDTISRVKETKEGKRVIDWLRKYDGDWLKQNLPMQSRQKSIITYDAKRRQRDADILHITENVILRLENSADCPKRITLSLVSKETGIPISSLRKLPKTYAYVKSKCQSVEAGTAMKIRWAFDELYRRQLPFYKSNIYELCRSRDAYVFSAKKELRKILNDEEYFLLLPKEEVL